MYPHPAHHVCSERCSFCWDRSGPICKRSGRRHRCSSDTCLNQHPQEGHTVCSWTGLVFDGVGSTIDRSYRNNVARQSGPDNDFVSSFGMKATGYSSQHSGRQSLKLASWSTSVSTKQSEIVKRCTIRTCESSSQHIFTHSSKRKKKNGNKPNNKTLVRGAKARLMPPPMRAGMLDNRPSRNRNIAMYMIWSLFMDPPSRQELRNLTIKKRASQWKSMIRKRSLQKDAYRTASCCIRDYADVCSQNPFTVDIVDCSNVSRTEAPTNIDASNACETISRRLDTGSLHAKLTHLCCNFIMEAWFLLCQTTIWKDSPPDFYSFVMGIIYISKDGGINVGDTSVIPHIKFFSTHAPAAGNLTQICTMQGVRDCRSAPFGRARITDGMNAIRSTLLYEHQNGGHSLSSLALQVPSNLQQSYASFELDSPWHVNNLPKYDL